MNALILVVDLLSRRPRRTWLLAGQNHPGPPCARPAAWNRGEARLFPKEEDVMPTKSEITSCLADGALALLAGSVILGLPLLIMLLGPG